MKIKIFQIKVNEGRREPSPEAIHELASSISEVGLVNPITVDKDYTLIAGLHRLEAAKLLGWTEIECNVSSLEGLLAELAEVDENVVRKDLSALEYNDLLLRRKEIYEMLHPETKNGGDRKSEKIRTSKCRSDLEMSFAQDTAGKLGVSKRTIERQIQTAKNLTPEAKDIIRDTGTKLTKQDALKLSRLAPEQQKDAANQLAAKDISSIDQYRPVLAEPKETKRPKPAPLPEVSDPPVSETGYYPTIRDSVADLKNPDKDRRITSNTYLISFALSLQRFCQNIKSYTGDEYEHIFPTLTREHLNQIQQEISSVHTTLENLYHEIERKSNK